MAAKQDPAKTAWIITCALLVALLVLSVYLGVTGNIFASPTGNAINTIILGEKVKINLRESGASVSTLAFNGAAIPGDSYNQDINLYLPFEEDSCFVRGAFFIVNSNGEKNAIKASLMENWISGTDGYFYFLGPMQNGQTSSLTKQITLPEDFHFKGNFVYNIVVLVETLSVDTNASGIWKTAPAEIFENPSLI